MRHRSPCFRLAAQSGIRARTPCSDEVFVRRVFLDMIGMLPDSKETRTFLHDKKRDKRARLSDDLDRVCRHKRDPQQ